MKKLGTAGAIAAGASLAAIVAAPAANAMNMENYNFYGGTAGVSFTESLDQGIVTIGAPHIHREPYGDFGSVCNYQARDDYQTPDGTYTYPVSNSSYHSGCSIIAWFDMYGDAGGYLQGTYYWADWKDTNTGNAFQKIGNDHINAV